MNFAKAELNIVSPSEGTEHFPVGEMVNAEYSI